MQPQEPPRQNNNHFRNLALLLLKKVIVKVTAKNYPTRLQYKAATQNHNNKFAAASNRKIFMR